MKQNKSVITALGLTGLLGLSVTPGWSQTKSGSSPAPTSPGSSQKDEGTSPSGSRAGQMKSGTTPLERSLEIKLLLGAPADNGEKMTSRKSRKR